MNQFDKEVQVYYDRYDKAMESNDIQELAFFSQFSTEPDIRKWDRRKICRNARNHQYWLACGLTGVVFGEYGWLEWMIPGYENQEFIPLGTVINRGSCNMTEKFALGIMQLPNGKWIARIDLDFSDIDHPFLYLGIHDEHFNSRSEAVNAAVKRFVDDWHLRNKDVKTEDEAVRKAKTLISVSDGCEVPKMAGEPVQLSLF